MDRRANSCAPPPLLAATAASGATSSSRVRSRGNGAHCSSITSPQSPRCNSSRSLHTGTHGHDPADDIAFSVEPPLTMSPLALALQAHWHQLQQDILSPSEVRLGHGDTTAAHMEEDILRVLRSIAVRADMAVNDAVHTVPYLLALGHVPLPSLRTQVIALAALRGVFSSLPGVYGEEAASSFVQDVLLGEHQALQALSLSALNALEEFDGAPGMHDSGSTKAHKPQLTPSLLTSSVARAPLCRSGHRSLLSRGQGEAPTEDGAGRAPWVHLDRPKTAPAHLTHSSTPSHFDKGTDALLDKPTALRGRVVHTLLQLFRDAAEMCGSVADALLSSAALLQACIHALHRLPPPTPPVPPGNVKGLVRGLSNDSCEAVDVVSFHHCEDVVSLVLTLLHSEATRHNEASLVLCSIDAPRAVCTLAQHLVHTPLFTSGAGCERSRVVTDEETSTLLWSALKVLVRLTRGCPAAMRRFLNENATLPAFLVEVLTVPVAEIREAGALWVTALLETQPQASAELASSLLDGTSLFTKTSSLASPLKAAAPSPASVPVLVASLMEMLHWRGEQMHVFGVSAILCWRWLLLSDPSRVAALLLRDSSLVATLIELILRWTASTSSSSSTALPTRLTALEALHVFALSYALGSLDTRARLEAHVVRGKLSHATLRWLRTRAHTILERTHPAYWSAFPTMEVELLEGEATVSEEMRLAGATVRTFGEDETDREPCASGPSASRLIRSRGGRGGRAVCISTGAAWRQLVLESVWDLTATAEVDASSTAVAAPSSVCDSVRRGRASTTQQPRRESLHTLDFHHRAGVSAGGACGASPISVLTSTSSSHAIAGTVHSARSSIPGDMDREGSTASLVDPLAHILLTRAPRTIREATLLPTRQSTTAFRFHVVQQAENLDGRFVQDSIWVVLHLAQHYTQASTSSRTPFQISPNRIHAVKERQRCGDLPFHGTSRETPRSRSRSASLLLPMGLRSSVAMASPSASFGTAPRFSDTSARIAKERNPFALVTPPAHVRQSQLQRRQWGVKELQREDVLLFLVHHTHLMTELPDAIAAIEDHLCYLRRQLQLCPTRVVRRRCVLNDLYTNVYPKLHLFLRYVDQQARRSRSVLQLLSTVGGGSIHSGNVLDVYDAVGQCTGLVAEE